MAKILYAINGEGLGHAYRSIAIIRELQKHHTIRIIVGSRRVYEHMYKEFPNIVQVEGLPIKYKNNAVDDVETVKEFLRITTKSTITNYRTVYTLIKKFRPHILITDFENISSYVARILNIPAICLCNVHAVTHFKYPVPKKYRKEYYKAKFVVVKNTCQLVDYHLITTFFTLPIKGKHTFVYPPVLRKEILQLKCNEGKHLLVYQTSDTNHRLIRVLKKLSHPVIFYGFNKEEIDGNITFRKNNHDQIFKDFASCKACIANGGFTFVSEAVSLHKPILCIPVKGQFEQILNALQIKELRYGDMADVATEAKIRAFIKHIPKYKKNLSTYKREDNSRIIKKVEEIIKFEIQKKRK
ncbi:MAG: MJ1255/VC2487 family glycosyltransferase [Candidatus Woesearchaeota archaeon]